MQYINRKRKLASTVEQPSKKRKTTCEETDDNVEVSPFPSFAIPKAVAKEMVYRFGNHIYFTDDVSIDSINLLGQHIADANREYDLLESTIKCAYMEPKPIYLHITSPGGDLFAGLRATDMIENSKIPIYTVTEGYAMSAASMMFVVGKKRFMTKNSYLLIHQLRSIEEGKWEDLKDGFLNNEELMNKMKDIYCTKSSGKLKRATLTKILQREKIMGYDDSLKHGLVDELYTGQDA